MDISERTRLADQARRIVPALHDAGVVGVATTWVDTSGITRVKAVPVARLEHAAAWGIGASPTFDTFLLDDSGVTGRYAGGPVGDLRLHPDLDRVVVLAAQPGWAWAPANRYATDGTVHPQDHRALAARQAAALAADGYSVRAAFEVEWVVSLGGSDAFTPACQGPAYGMTRLTEQSDYLRDLLTALAAEGVAVDQIHPEYAAGQYEVSVAAQDPVAAADTAVLVRETIRAVTARAGMRASFAPKVVAGGVGNGGHVHLSLWKNSGPAQDGGQGQGGGNAMSGGGRRYGLTAAGEGFAAGILAHLPALLALGAPSVASYLRLVPSHWAGAYACWGLENREAALRFVTGAAGERDRAANLEVKAFDAAANPYLAIAGLLAAGRAGLAEAAALPDPVEVDPATLTDAERAGRGIRRLPVDLAGSVAEFEADKILPEALGPECGDTVVAVRRGEIALFAGADDDEIVARTRWRY
jgi:glutamine synthetase